MFSPKHLRLLSILVVVMFLVLVVPPSPAHAGKGKLIDWGIKALKGIGGFLGVYGAEKALDHALDEDSDDEGCYSSCTCSPTGSCHSGCDCPNPSAADPQTYGDGAHNHYGSGGYYYNSGSSYY